MNDAMPQSTRELAVVDAIEAIDAIPAGDQLVEVQVWQYAPEATKHASMWAWYVRMESEVGPGSSGKRDGMANRRIAKALLIRGADRWGSR